ncbi:hypothetical protein [Rhizobium leguminosarum]|uniref:hypothetical protein n=1 Tax=Rhizobium leguminosarum TaxID=384 RepID=UPI0015DABF5F|nr:hypothetical protein [Rhizobium leguminosarum]NZD53225.1 hypothetical protein [Rhizobium leguminosarum]
MIRFAGPKNGGGRSGAAVVDDRTHLPKQPVVRGAADDMNVLGFTFCDQGIASKSQDAPLALARERLDNSGCHSGWIDARHASVQSKNLFSNRSERVLVNELKTANLNVISRAVTDIRWKTACGW